MKMMRNFLLRRHAKVLGAGAALAALLFLLPTFAQAIDLLHNSRDTGSTKWQAQGGWGVAGGKYGEFICATCHEPDADGIKNIRNLISTMNGENWPNGQPDVTVVFQNQSGMGNDSLARSTSARICEVCHSQNRFHNFNTANNTGGLGHPNPMDICTKCHKHNTGFKAACGGCHGNPPKSASFGNETGLIGTPRPSNALTPGQAGAHHTHTEVRSMVCDTCHYINNGTIKMPNQSGSIDIGFFGFGGKVTSGTYVPYSSTSRGYRFGSGTAGTVIAPAATTYATANKCLNVYCHGGGAPGKAALTGGANQTPRWDATGQNACGNCHGTTAATPPTLGSHQKHAAASGGYSYSCDLCHPVSGDNSHVQGNVRWQLKISDPKVGAAATYRGLATGSTGDLAPSAAYGACASVYCHSDGKGGAGLLATPSWGQSLPAGCIGCHGGAAGSSAPLTSGKHSAHIDNAAVLGSNYACGDCHAQAVSGNTSVVNTSRHVSGFVDYSGLRAGKSSTYSSASGVCSAAYCHSDGKGTQKVMTGAGWRSATFLDCTGCHGTDAAPAFSSVAGEPNYSNAGGGQPRANSHLKHVGASGATTCVNCHYGTVTAGGTAIAAGSALHTNRVVDVAQGGGNTFSWNPATHGCSTISCHGGGSASWGDASGVGCKVCHNSLSGVHGAHVGNLLDSGLVTFYAYTANKSVGSSYRYGCATCHPTDPLKHRNGTVELTLNSTKPGAGYLNALNTLVTTDSGGYTKLSASNLTCETVYCHSNGKTLSLALADYRQTPNWFGGAFGANRCGSCHDNPPQYGGQSHYNPASSIGNNGKSPARETGHLVGIHFRNIYVGNKQTGFLGFSSSGTKAHGNPAVATTISCYFCHSGIVSSTLIDTYALSGTGSTFRCGSCHTPTSRTPLQPGQIANAALHINGAKDVVFAPVTVKTKAQLANVANALGWTRAGTYKAAASYDSFDLTVSSWNSQSKTCLTACHVNQPGIIWGAALKCVSCHANQ